MKFLTYLKVYEIVPIPTPNYARSRNRYICAQRHAYVVHVHLHATLLISCSPPLCGSSRHALRDIVIYHFEYVALESQDILLKLNKSFRTSEFLRGINYKQIALAEILSDNLHNS
jgi:hypothetical protein